MIGKQETVEKIVEFEQSATNTKTFRLIILFQKI
jgi:hypothetical protein